MSKPSLDMLVARKGSAAPATLQVPQETSNEGTKEPREEVRQEAVKEVSKPVVAAEPAKRKRPWDGMDEPIKGNFEVTKGLLAKLAWLKSANQIKTQKDFVFEVLEREADKLIAKAEKEGY